jgi:phosphoglycolate phosphatase-like HAD superfamily hydrolase
MSDGFLASSRRSFLKAALFASVAKFATQPALADDSDPLPSWANGPVKSSITDFVERIGDEDGKDFIDDYDRIAVFDNDGTLWAEQPIYFQFAFAIDRVKASAPQHPEWATTEPFKSVLADNVPGILAAGEKGLLEILAASHTGVTTAEFSKTVDQWLATAKHPRFNRPYVDLVYQPMLELLNYLRANEFKTFIVSGGGIEFMRQYTEKSYGIPPEQVVGSSGVTKYQMGPDNKPVLMKEPKVEFVDDGPGKPVGINRFIGRQPVFAFGNSDGDKEMLEWTAAAQGPSFMGIVHHTDAVREWAYDRNSHIGKLDKAWDEAVARGWTVVDMKKDWLKIFPFDE